MEECIFSTDNEIEALQVKELLENNGIVTYAKNLYTQNILGATKLFTGMDLLAGSIEIFVAGNDVDKAIAILNEGFSTIDNGLEETEEDKESEKDDTQYAYDIKPVEKTDNNIKSILGRSFFLSIFSFLISPIFFNIGNLINLWKSKRNMAIVNIIFTIISLSLSIIGMFYIMDYVDFILIINLFLVPALFIIKGISAYIRDKSIKSIIYIFIAIIIIVFFGIVRIKLQLY